MKHTQMREAGKLAISTCGILILGLSINFLSWKYKLVSGGLPGYALSINIISGYPVGLVLFIANSVILLTSFLVAGKTAGFRAVFGYTVLSFFIDASRTILGIQQVELTSFLSSALYMMLQGLIAPLAISAVLANGYSFGSYSSMIPLVQKISKISAPRFFLIMDTLLTVLTLIFFGLEKAILLLINAVVFFLVFRSALPFSEKHLALDNKVRNSI